MYLNEFVRSLTHLEFLSALQCRSNEGDEYSVAVSVVGSVAGSIQAFIVSSVA